MNQIRAIVLYAKPWRVIEENTGQVREGVSIEYLMADDLSPVTNDDGSVGYRVFKESININNLSRIVKVPGIYDITYGFTVQKGQANYEDKGYAICVRGVVEWGQMKFYSRL